MEQFKSEENNENRKQRGQLKDQVVFPFPEGYINFEFVQRTVAQILWCSDGASWSPRNLRLMTQQTDTAILNQAGSEFEKATYGRK